MNHARRFVIDLANAAAQAAGCSFHDLHDIYIALIEQWAPAAQSLVDEAVAAELERHATFLHDSAALYEPAAEVAAANSEDMAMVLDMQIKMLRQVAMTLTRRAANVRGISAEELAARAILLLPNNGHKTPEKGTDVDGQHDPRDDPRDSADGGDGGEGNGGGGE